MPKFGKDYELLRTCRLYEADILAEALQKEKIPFDRIQEEFGGIRMAPAVPPQPGLGLTNLIIVPADTQTRACAILEDLPIAPDPYPGLTGFTRSARRKLIIKVAAALALIAIAAGYALPMLLQ